MSNAATSGDLGLAPSAAPAAAPGYYTEDIQNRLPELPAIEALNLPPQPAVQLPTGDASRWVPGVAPGMAPTQEDPQAATFEALVKVAGKTFQVQPMCLLS
jgi:hypothetical protein